MAKCIGIVGSRSRNTLKTKNKIYKKFINLLLEDGDYIVSGGCPKGADRFAEEIAKKEQVPIMIYYAQWERKGKSAGFQRNTDIAKEADILIACPSKDRTGGTEDTIKKFKKFHPNGRLILL